MLNHIVVMGRLTRDPELRKTASGVSVASFSVAVDRDFSQQDGKKETDFLRGSSGKGEDRKRAA